MITAPILQTGELRFREVTGNLLGATTLGAEEHALTKNCSPSGLPSWKGSIQWVMPTVKRDSGAGKMMDIPKL